MFVDAMVKVDLAALASTYAEDYVFTDPAGRVSHKAELLDSFQRGVIRIRSQEISNVQVNVYGEVAVEIGKVIKSQATRDGHDSGGTYRFTRVWGQAQWSVADGRIPRDPSNPGILATFTRATPSVVQRRSLVVVLHDSNRPPARQSTA